MRIQTESDMFKRLYLCGAAVALATAIACGSGEQSSSPVSPSAGGTVDAANAGGGGETLKVTAPTPLAPANGSTIDTFGPTLRVTPSTFKFQGAGAITHRFQLLNGSTVIAESTTPGATWVPSNLQNKTTYSWRVRGEQALRFGPWSDTWTFTTPDQPEGYVRGNELYDPLYTGKTIGRPVGAVSFVPGLGVRLETLGSYVKYYLQQTLSAGEFSVLVTNLHFNTEGDKTKIISMIQGDDDQSITTNDRRFTLEKRGNPPGIVAWRMLTSNEQIDTVGKERVVRQFSPSKTYLWKATWGGNRYDAEIREGGANGAVMYRFGKHYRGVYDPAPHRAFIGGPAGRAGLDSGTVPGIVVRQVWISANPRPAFANR
jgi:hypothetical protein